MRFLEAYEEGAVPSESITAEDVAELAAFKEEEKRREHDYEGRHKHLAGRLAAPSFPNFASQVFYTDSPTNLVYKVCKHLKMKPDENFAKATVHVVQDRGKLPTECPGQLVAWLTRQHTFGSLRENPESLQ